VSKIHLTDPVFTCFNPYSVVLTTKVADHQSAARGLIAEHVCQFAPKQHATSFRALSNDDHQKLVTMVISPST